MALSWPAGILAAPLLAARGVVFGIGGLQVGLTAILAVAVARLGVPGGSAPSSWAARSQCPPLPARTNELTFQYA
jgi:hypothetical protein